MKFWKWVIQFCVIVVFTLLVATYSHNVQCLPFFLVRPLLVVVVDGKVTTVFGVVSLRLPLWMVAWLLGIEVRHRAPQYQTDRLFV